MAENEVDWAKTTMPLVPTETAGGMTWQEVKDFLDHIRTTCMDERTALKLEVRHLRAENARLAAQIDGSTDGSRNDGDDDVPRP